MIVEGFIVVDWLLGSLRNDVVKVAEQLQSQNIRVTTI